MPFQINKILCIEDEKKPTDNFIEYVITQLGSDDLNTVRIHVYVSLDDIHLGFALLS